ncbi:hypothetical protein KEM48_002257 [Puccinia striiformis f. sp. tritici PST-130]|nr:hypothetical protein KEM48_002257 [Puccinia striiformis f. sp. tritici PST-130]
MAKGGGKGAGAKAAKSAHEDQVKEQKQKELEDAEAAQWADGAKESKASKKEKAEKAAAAKAERERLLSVKDDVSIRSIRYCERENGQGSLGAKAAKGVDAHPERRFKAAFEAYKENELPTLRKDQPGLRLQHNVSYDATKEDKVAALETKKKDIEERLKTN